MASTRRAVPLATLLVAELAAVWLLHQLGDQAWARIAWDGLPGWLAGAGAVDALMAALRLVALAVGWWVLATTVLTAVAALVGADGLAGWVRPLTLSVVRRVVDRCVAAGVSAALVVPVAPAAALQDPRPPPGLGEPPAVEPPDVELGGARPADAGHGDGQHPRASASGWHVVVAGEHLWGIAAQHLAEHRGTSRAALARDDLAAYWLAVVEANRDRLPSGDPDLIRPGERVRLPPA